MVSAAVEPKLVHSSFCSVYTSNRRYDLYRVLLVGTQPPLGGDHLALPGGDQLGEECMYLVARAIFINWGVPVDG